MREGVSRPVCRSVRISEADTPAEKEVSGKEVVASATDDDGVTVEVVVGGDEVGEAGVDVEVAAGVDPT